MRNKIVDFYHIFFNIGIDWHELVKLTLKNEKIIL